MNYSQNVSRSSLSLLTAGIVVLMVSTVWLYQSSNPLGSALPDFTLYKAGPDRKTAFFEYLAPLVERHNAQLSELHKKLELIATDIHLDKNLRRSQERFLNDLAIQYRIDTAGLTNLDLVNELVIRVDIIPTSLVLAQAATESGWGTSRFARIGNNLFGQWCYSPGCGIVPGERTAGSTHEVQYFEFVGDALESYFLNINTHRQYEDLRKTRHGLREQLQKVTGEALAEGLLYYSERREAYVEEVQKMIRINKAILDKV